MRRLAAADNTAVLWLCEDPHLLTAVATRGALHARMKCIYRLYSSRHLQIPHACTHSRGWCTGQHKELPHASSLSRTGSSRWLNNRALSSWAMNCSAPQGRPPGHSHQSQLSPAPGAWLRQWPPSSAAGAPAALTNLQERRGCFASIFDCCTEPHCTAVHATNMHTPASIFMNTYSLYLHAGVDDDSVRVGGSQHHA